jgi:hypothetical protein
MTLPLPPAIAQYLAADGDDAAADDTWLGTCFDPDAVVRDEGQAHRGWAAIRAWKAAVQAKYQCRQRPLHLSREGERYKLLVQVTGNFPGGCIDLMYVFTLKGDLIAALEIRLPVGLESVART